MKRFGRWLRSLEEWLGRLVAQLLSPVKVRVSENWFLATVFLFSVFIVGTFAAGVWLLTRLLNPIPMLILTITFFVLYMVGSHAYYSVESEYQSAVNNGNTA